MNTELIEPKSWWNRNWKWFVPIGGMILMLSAICISFGVLRITTNFAQAYADTELYENALLKVNANPKIENLLGKIEPLGNMAIIEGETKYSQNNQSVSATVQIIGTKGKAKMDIVAERIREEWKYSKINIRIKNPPEKKQTIEIITTP